MGFVLLVDNNVFKNDFKDYIYNNLFMFILCKNKVHLLLNYVIYVIMLISRLFEQKNERTSQIKLINIIKQLK